MHAQPTKIATKDIQRHRHILHKQAHVQTHTHCLPSLHKSAQKSGSNSTVFCFLSLVQLLFLLLLWVNTFLEGGLSPRPRRDQLLSPQKPSDSGLFCLLLGNGAQRPKKHHLNPDIPCSLSLSVCLARSAPTGSAFYQFIYTEIEWQARGGWGETGCKKWDLL